MLKASLGKGRIHPTAKFDAILRTPMIHIPVWYSLPLYRNIIAQIMPPRFPVAPTNPDSVPTKR